MNAVLNSTEFTILRSDIFADLSNTNIVSIDNITKYKDTLMTDTFFANNQKYLPNTILQMIKGYVEELLQKNPNTDISTILDNNLTLINDNIYQIDIPFYKSYFLVNANETKHPDIIDRISLYEGVTYTNINNPLFEIDYKNTLLKLYLFNPYYNIEKIKVLASDLKTLIVERNEVYDNLV